MQRTAIAERLTIGGIPLLGTLLITSVKTVSSGLSWGTQPLVLSLTLQSKYITACPPL